MYQRDSIQSKKIRNGPGNFLIVFFILLDRSSEISFMFESEAHTEQAGFRRLSLS